MTTPPDIITSATGQDIIAYTDGACSGNPGVGGWGALIEADGVEYEFCGGEAHTTNNRMEMMAALMALRHIASGSAVRLVTDSTYLKDGFTEWLPRWKQRRWRTSSRKPVKNADLWQALDEEAAHYHITWEWVRGHTGHSGNERADELARRGLAGAGTG